MVAGFIDVDVDDLAAVEEPRPRLSGRVAERSRRQRPGTVLADVLVAPFYLVGWLVFWVLVGAIGVIRWCVAAVQVGWEDARAQAHARGLGVGRWPVQARVRKPVPASGTR